MIGTLVLGHDPQGPAFYVDTDNGTFPVAITSPIEGGLLRLWTDKRVQFTPKTMGTRTNPDTHKLECIVFATDVRSLNVN
jgi:hypothetical protein